MRSFFAIPAITGLFLLGSAAQAQNYPRDRDDYYAERTERADQVGSLIDRVDRDLDRVQSFARAPHELRRVESARDELAESRKKWGDGRFDSGELSEAIARIQTVVDRTPLDQRDRGILVEDLARLRDLRANPPHAYEYPR